MSEFENYQLWDNFKSAKRDKKYPTGHTYRRSEKCLKNFNPKLNGLKVNIHQQDFRNAKFAAILDNQEYIVDLTKIKNEQNEELFSINKRRNWLLPEILTNLNQQVYFKMDKPCENIKAKMVKNNENMNYEINSSKMKKSENEIDEKDNNENKNSKKNKKKFSKSQNCYKISALLDNETKPISVKNQIDENIKEGIKIKRKHKPKKKTEIKPNGEKNNNSDQSDISTENKKKESNENQQKELFSVKFYETTKSYNYNNYTKERLPNERTVQKLQNEPLSANIDKERSLLAKKPKLKTFNDREVNRGRHFIKKLLESFVEINDDLSLYYKPLFGVRAFEDRYKISQKCCVELNKSSGSNFTKIDSVHNLNEEHVCNICCDASNSLLRLEPCLHIACKMCWEQYCTKTIDSFKSTGISNGKIKQLSCLYQNCDTILDIKTLSSVIPQTYITKYINYYTELSIISNDNYVMCNNDKCNKIIITNNQSSVAICECDTAICSKCGENAHYPASCELYASYRKIVPLKKKGNKLDLINWVDIVKGKSCPKCKRFAERVSGCDRIRCVCGTYFCWRCLQIFGIELHICNNSIKPVIDSEITLFKIPNLQVLKALQENISKTDSLLLELQESNFIDNLNVTVAKNSKKVYQFLLTNNNLKVNIDELIKRCLRQFCLNLIQMLSMASALAIEEVTKQYLVLKPTLKDIEKTSSTDTEEFDHEEIKQKLELLVKQITHFIKYYEGIRKLLPNVTNIYRFYDLVLHNQRMRNLLYSVSSSDSSNHSFT